jgi:hypothetical protein
VPDEDAQDLRIEAITGDEDLNDYAVWFHQNGMHELLE